MNRIIKAVVRYSDFVVVAVALVLCEYIIYLGYGKSEVPWVLLANNVVWVIALCVLFICCHYNLALRRQVVFRTGEWLARIISIRSKDDASANLCVGISMYLWVLVWLQRLPNGRAFHKIGQVVGGKAWGILGEHIHFLLYGGKLTWMERALGRLPADPVPSVLAPVYEINPALKYLAIGFSLYSAIKFVLSRRDNVVDWIEEKVDALERRKKLQAVSAETATAITAAVVATPAVQPSVATQPVATQAVTQAAPLTSAQTDQPATSMLSKSGFFGRALAADFIAETAMVGMKVVAKILGKI